MSEKKEQTRTLYFTKEVDVENVVPIIKSIIEINEYDEKMKTEKVNYTPEPIKLHIISDGGSVYAGFALVDAITNSETPVYTFGHGMVASMALALFTSGHKRFAYENATFLYHSVRSGNYGTLRQRETSQEELQNLQDMYDNLLLSRTHVTKEALAKYVETSRDWFIRADLAKKLGFVHEVIKGIGG